MSKRVTIQKRPQRRGHGTQITSGKKTAADRRSAENPFGLSLAEQLFVQHWLRFHSAKRAYQEVFPDCTEPSALSAGPRMFGLARVQEAIRAAEATLLKQLEADNATIIGNVAASAFADPADCYDPETGAPRPIHEMPVSVRRAIESIEHDEQGTVRKVRLAPRASAQRLLMQHKGLLKEVAEVQHDVRFSWEGGNPWQTRADARGSDQPSRATRRQVAKAVARQSSSRARARAPWPPVSV